MKFLNLKFIISFLLVFVVIFISKTSFVHADAIDELVINPANSLLELILKGLSWMLAFLGTLVDDVMQPQSILQADIVKTGWRITRDFANMFFILILLAIALSFILFPRFQIKQALPRLLLIALLINFSLPIAGIFIDFANIFTKYFLDQAATGGNISELIASQLNITAIRDVSEQALTANIGNTPGQIFLSLLFGIVFVSVVIFIFIALAFMFLIRNIYLYILLIILPLALVASILPSGRSYFSQWSHKFFQWTFFAPIATFFIFLSMVSFSSIIKADAAPLATDAGVGFLAGTYDYIIILLLLMGSLFAANSLGVQTAGVTNKMMKYGGKALRGGWSGVKKVNHGIQYSRERFGKPASQKARETSAEYSAKGGLINTLIGKYHDTRADKLEAHIPDGVLSKEEKEKAKRQAKENPDQLLGRIKLPGLSARKKTELQTIAAEEGILKEKDARGIVDPKKTKKMLGDVYEKALKIGNKELVEAISKNSPALVLEKLEEKIDGMNSLELQKKYGVNTKEKAKKAVRNNLFRKINTDDITKMWDTLDKSSRTELVANKVASGMSIDQVKKIHDSGMAPEFSKEFEKLATGQYRRQRKDLHDVFEENTSIIRSFQSAPAKAMFGEEGLTERRTTTQAAWNQRKEKKEGEGKAKKEEKERKAEETMI